MAHPKRDTTETEVAQEPASRSPIVEGGYETFDGNEALAYNQAGGRLIAITKRYPNNPFKPGKRYRFLETKAELEALLAKNSAEEARG